MTFNLDHDVFPLHLENHRDVLYSPLKTSQRIKYTCFAVSRNYLIFGATSGGLYIFKRHPYLFQQLIPSQESAITLIAISPSQSLIACVTNKNIIRIIEVTENYSGKLVTRVEELSEFDITSLCWTDDVAKPTLFIGDVRGRVYYLRLSFLSKNILNIPIMQFMALDSKIIQLCCDNDLLVISTLTRCYIYDSTREHYKQVGQQLRDGFYGATFLKSRKRIFCARPGSRLWEVDLAGEVHSTHQFKKKLAIPPSTFISLLDEPKITTGSGSSPSTTTSFNFTKLYDLLGRYIVTYHGDRIYVLNTDTVDVLFWCNCFGNVVDLQCSHSSVFVWNANGDLHELVFLPVEKYVLALYLKSHYELCIRVLCILYEKLISSSAFHELYPLKDWKWPSEQNDSEDCEEKVQILAKIKEKLATVVANETKLRSGIHVVNNQYHSRRLLDDSAISVHRPDISTGDSDIVENGEHRKRSNSLPSSLKKSILKELPKDTNSPERLGHPSNLYDGIDTDSELYNSPFVTFASYHILRENFSELGANFSQIFNDSSRNLKQKWLTFEGKITSRAEDPSVNISAIRVPQFYQDEEVVEIDDQPIVERRQVNSDPQVDDTNELEPLFSTLKSNPELDDDLILALNEALRISTEENPRLLISMAMAPSAVKDVFTGRCFVKSFLSTWFDSKTFPVQVPSNLSDQYPPMLALLFDEEELKFDFLLNSILVVFGFLLEGQTILDTIKSFRLPCYYKSFNYVLKLFQKDEPSDYKRVEGERIDWPVPVYLNTMLLMISVDRKDVFCEMGIKKSVDVVDTLYLLLHAVQIDSKNESSSLLHEYKHVWLNYVQKRHCERNTHCLEDPFVFRLALHALISCNARLQDSCCSNCWFLLPQTSTENVAFQSLSCAVLTTFWSILTRSLNSDGIDYATLLLFRRAISDTFKYQSCSTICYKDVENCEHLICRKFSEKINRSDPNATTVLAFNAICNLCYRVPFLWKYLSSLQTNEDPIQLLDVSHFIQLDNIQQLRTFYPPPIGENEALAIFDCMTSLSEGRCLNCNAKAFDISDRISWDDVGTFALQHLGATRTLKLLQRFSIANVNLSSSFYRAALLISLPKIGPDITNRALSIMSNHCHSNYVSSADFAELHAAYDRDNVSKQANCISASASDAHHWGISVQAVDDIRPKWRNFSLEDFALREEKVLHLPVNSASSYVLNRPTHNRVPPSGANGALLSTSDVSKEVSETDLYLLGAIEKLVYKIDLLDQRLKRAEELLQHVIEGPNIKRQDPCPANYTRITQYCYHFNERQYNWKSASSMCKSLGGNLAEFESKEEYREIISHILSDPSIRGHDYWTGGLNPGLLWIWSNSARPVVPKNSTLPEDAIGGSGRCLKLAYSGSTKVYSYAGAECSVRFKFICEHEENLTDRALKRIHKALKSSG